MSDATQREWRFYVDDTGCRRCRSRGFVQLGFDLFMHGIVGTAHPAYENYTASGPGLKWSGQSSGCPRPAAQYWSAAQPSSIVQASVVGLLVALPSMGV
jgi:hypothetical protein